LLAVLAVAALAPSVLGHGRLVVPAGRSSAWRYGFNTPHHYSDNELFCGGFKRQWEVNGGKCGICGDPYDRVREHEAGGKYATGTITASYQQGAVIDVIVDITANHLGYFEFRLCPHNDVKTPAKQECFDRYLLHLDERPGTRLPITSDMYLTKLKLKLPEFVTCDQCILQWKYNTGNSWGVDTRTGEMGMGMGPQEQFYGCADISIHPREEPVVMESQRQEPALTEPDSVENPHLNSI